MNSLLIFLVRHDNTASLAAHLMAGLAALALLIGTAWADAPAVEPEPAVAVRVAPAVPSSLTEARRVELPVAAVASAHAVRR